MALFQATIILCGEANLAKAYRRPPPAVLPCRRRCGNKLYLDFNKIILLTYGLLVTALDFFVLTASGYYQSTASAAASMQSILGLTTPSEQCVASTQGGGSLVHEARRLRMYCR